MISNCQLRVQVLSSTVLDETDKIDHGRNRTPDCSSLSPGDPSVHASGVRTVNTQGHEPPIVQFLACVLLAPSVSVILREQSSCSFDLIVNCGYELSNRYPEGFRDPCDVYQRRIPLTSLDATEVVRIEPA
jgi:hypothetical protein